MIFLLYVLIESVVSAAYRRSGVKVSFAVILSLLLTPATGFLYCLCFPEKKEEEE